ncbi:MAG: IPTL-CTERM sorting domain-containing protein [Methylophilus sp.]|nr:IPTL-CTERM sorting domain-containing protein [Methylophilus sp.]
MKKYLLPILFSFLQTTFCNCAYAIEWSNNTVYGDNYFSSGFHYCGTNLGKFEEKGISPKKIADAWCVRWAQQNACETAAGFPAHTGGPPSIFNATVVTESTYFTNYEYRFQCTGSSITSPYISIINASESKGTLSAGDDPKNQGDPTGCPANMAVGNPINLGNGNKYQNESVYHGISSLRFNLAYNSKYDTDEKLFGDAWRSSYDRGLSVDILGLLGIASIKRQDGKGFDFKNINGVLTADADKTYSLTQVTDGQGTNIGWQFNDDISGETELYDATGKLLSISDRAGLTQALTYSTTTTPTIIAPASNLLIQVTDYVGRSLNFAYDASKRVAKMSDPSGAQYNFSYSASNFNLLKTLTYQDGTIKTFHYGSELGEALNAPSVSSTVNNNSRSLTGITDENGNRFATWVYNTGALAISSEHAGGVDKVTLSYLANGPGGTHPVNTAVTDSRGTVRTYNIINTTIYRMLKPTSQSQPAGAGCVASASALTYDANGNVASRTDFNGNKTTYVYGMGRNLETSRTEGLNTAGAATVATRTITTTWHPTWRLPLVISEYSGGANTSGVPTGTLLRQTTTAYDSKGNITSFTETDPVLNKSRSTTITYTYSTAVPGLVLSKVVDGAHTDMNDTTTYTYYPHDATCVASSATPIIDPITGVAPANLGCRGQLQSVTDALGHITQYTRYNHHGQVEQMIDANNVVTEMTYDLRQRMLTRTVAAGTTLAATTQLEYDAVGQLKKIIRPEASHIDYTYDAAHRLTDITDTLGNQVHYTLDTEGNITQTDYRNPDGSTLKRDTFAYDALNRLQHVIDGHDNIETHAYDPNGNLTQVIDGKSKLTQYTVDKLDRTTQVQDALNGISRTDYNAIDQSILVKAPNNAQTTYQQDALGNVLTETSPNRGSTTATYDNAGNALTINDARGTVSTTTWDALNRPLTTQYPQTGENITYTWDATSGSNTCSNGKGRLCQITDSSGTTSFAYDARGNLITKTRTVSGHTRTTTYQYDSADRLLLTMSPTGKQINSLRNTDGEIQQVSATTNNGLTNVTSTLVDQIETNVLGKTDQQVFGNNVTQSNSYNLLGSLASLNYVGTDPDVGGGGTGNGNDNADVPTLPEWATIMMGALLLLLSFRQQRLQTNSTHPTSSVRAESVTQNQRKASSKISSFMQRLHQCLLLAGISLLTGIVFNLNPYVLSSAQAATTLDYDENHNVTTITTPQGTTSYGYDDLNRLNSEAGVVKTQSFSYDPNANRTGSTSPLDGSKTYTYTPNTDKLATINGQSITLDPAGNTLTARGYTYTWNQAGQLKTVSLGNTLLATYTYDYKGLRVLKTTTAAAPQGVSTIEYSYDESDHLLSEIRHPNDNLYTYVWRDDIPVAVIIHPAAQQLANPTQAISNADQIIYLETDHLNTPRIGRDQSGKKVWSWESDAFGSTLANEDPDNDGHKVIINLRFPGQQFDQESGLHYNHHRYYDPQLGRYTNSDPSGLEGGLNSYGYANQSPLKYVDPNGKNALLLLGGGALGLGIGLGLIPNPFNSPIANNGNNSDFPLGGAGAGASSSSSSSNSSSESNSKKECEPDDRCKKVKNECISSCSIFGLPSKYGDGVSFRRCIRNCMERENCFNF